MLPKILLLDIETAPDVVYTWSVYESNAIDVKQHWQLLSFSAKWLDTKTHITKGLPDYPGYKAGGDDKLLVKELWSLLDDADIVVGHNAAQFDVKKIQARMIAHGMTPPSPFKVVDTKRAVKHVAAFSSNKLDWLGSQLDLGRKLAHQGWSMWKGCLDGDPKAWKQMLRYNKHDVVLLEELYRLLAPWLEQPNAGMWAGDEPVCPNPICGSKNLQRRGVVRSKTRVYQRFVCKDCGAWARGSKSISGAQITATSKKP